MTPVTTRVAGADPDVVEAVLETPRNRNDDLADLARHVANLIEHVHTNEQRFGDRIEATHPKLRESARNLVHYLAIRRFDLRNLQESLAQWGLSSLGRTEGHVLSTLTAVSRVLARLNGELHAPLEPVDFSESRSRLSMHAIDLFGSSADGRGGRIMVTLPSEAADDYRLVRDLLRSGTDVMRINCAHDEPRAWERMIEHIRRAEAESGECCKILMDLAGAKPRTGRLEPGPEVVTWKPKRNRLGQVVAPAHIWLAPPEIKPPDSIADGREDAGVDALLPVAESWLRAVRLGDHIRFRDARSKKRSMRIVERWGSGVVAESDKTAYVTSGTSVELRPGDDRAVPEKFTDVGRLPAIEVPIVLHRGDRLILHAGDTPGRLAIRDDKGALVAPARVPCSLPEVFPDLRVDEPVKLDDGKIEGVIRAVSTEEVEIEIMLAKPTGSKLRADKGINFPESDLRARGLTPKDFADLDFIVRHAPLVVDTRNATRNVAEGLQNELKERHAEHVGIVLKIETQRGFRQLPDILLRAMQSYPIGVMIARGDLAVECGWERTAEVQEEILWLCEAAHVPVIWATQVLEGLTKNGIPSRAEITDAAMAERAECVMLNKGPYIVKAIRTLDDVLKRMEGHQSKKTALLRSLNVSDLVANGD